MSDKKSKDKGKRLSKGQRLHMRRLKQAARKEASPNIQQSSAAQPARAPKKQDQSQ